MEFEDATDLSDHAPDCVCGRSPGLEETGCVCGRDLDPLLRVSEAALDGLGHKLRVKLPSGVVGDPTESGYRRSRLGKPRGQKRDYRLHASELRDDDGRELHLREFEDGYTLHVDAHPVTSPMHVVRDAPDYGAGAAVAAVAVVAGAVVGRRISGRSDADGTDG